MIRNAATASGVMVSLLAGRMGWRLVVMASASNARDRQDDRVA